MLKQVWLLRRMVSIISQDSASTEATERVLERLAKTQDNAEFLASINKPGGP
jgi:transcription termination factor Rho